MQLTEIIIRAHVHIHAAELAIRGKAPGAAVKELCEVRELLNDQLGPEAEEVAESPEPE